MAAMKEPREAEEEEPRTCGLPMTTQGAQLIFNRAALTAGK